VAVLDVVGLQSGHRASLGSTEDTLTSQNVHFLQPDHCLVPSGSGLGYQLSSVKPRDFSGFSSYSKMVLTLLSYAWRELWYTKWYTRLPAIFPWYACQ
jgi:hypothetical protein